MQQFLCKDLPFVVLSDPSVGIKTCLIESGLTLKPPNMSCLTASDRRIKTLVTTTFCLNLIMKSGITLPHLDKGGRGGGRGGGSKEYHHTYLYFGDFYVLKYIET